MTDLSAVLSPGPYKGWVFDPQHQTVDFITTAGALKVWSLESQAYTLSLSLPGGPSTIDISPDGGYVVVGNHDTVTTTSPATASLSRIDLSTHAVDQILVQLPSASQQGLLHLVTGADGSALFNRENSQTYISPFTTISVAGNGTPQPVAALANLNPFDALIRSDDHRYVLLGGGLGSSRLDLYDTTSGALVAERDVDNSKAGHGDVSVTAGMAVNVTYNSLVAFDLNLNVVQDLSARQVAGGVLGATFSDDGHQLFLYRGGDPAFGTAGSIAILDTRNWTQIGSISVSSIGGGPTAFGSNAGQLQVAGKFLLIDEGSQLEAVDLSAREHLTVTVAGDHHDLWGGLGQDSLLGSTSHDVLTGGLGADTLTGGGGADDFVMSAGDSLSTGFDVITDWAGADRISFTRSVASSAYTETTAADFNSAKAAADAQIAQGTDYVAVGVGGDVYLFADSRGDNGVADDVVRLVSRSLADIGADNIRGAPVVSGPAATLPPLPALPTGGAQTLVNGDMEAAHLIDLLPAIISQATSSLIQINGPSNGHGGYELGLSVAGVGFDYVNNQLVSGTANSFNFIDVTPGFAFILNFAATGVHVPATLLLPWVAADATQVAFQTILAGNDVIGGSSGVDLIHGYAGNDFISGLGGSDTIYGGLGDDVLYEGIPSTAGAVPYGGAMGEDGSTYLRGEEGADYIIGGGGFDDINGNQGADTASGGRGADWVVGGKDDDLLFGDVGADIVYGNLGNDTCDGGADADLIRGGQGDDVLTGGDGDDWLSGDRGSDTVSGGAGADTFHTFSGAGMDRVLDFNPWDGDRVQIDAGTTYTVTQVGADLVIDMAAGDQMVLVGVQLSSLPANWLFVV